uniref:Uncharacterized protein n=1 Tax=Nelumbo nucifera TaxID=4432 RepID=A0A822XXZ8_NELNU|nr:TPA_asm: hypothetical protein HUJ06_026694 [Nelumbo nucifera]
MLWSLIFSDLAAFSLRENQLLKLSCIPSSKKFLHLGFELFGSMTSTDRDLSFNQFYESEGEREGRRGFSERA